MVCLCPGFGRWPQPQESGHALRCLARYGASLSSPVFDNGQGRQTQGGGRHFRSASEAGAQGREGSTACVAGEVKLSTLGSASPRAHRAFEAMQYRSLCFPGQYDGLQLNTSQISTGEGIAA